MTTSTEPINTTLDAIAWMPAYDPALAATVPPPKVVRGAKAHHNATVAALRLRFPDIVTATNGKGSAAVNSAIATEMGRLRNDHEAGVRGATAKELRVTYPPARVPLHLQR